MAAVNASMASMPPPAIPSAANRKKRQREDISIEPTKFAKTQQKPGRISLTDRWNYQHERLTALRRSTRAALFNERLRDIVPDVVSYFAENSIHRKPPVEGLERVRKIKQKLEDMFAEKENGRFPFQHKLHDQCIRASLRQILGPRDYARLKHQVCREFGWNGVVKNVLSEASRRSGKTVALAALVAALMIYVPNSKFVAFAIKQATSEMFVSLVRGFVMNDPEGSKMVHEDAKQHLVLKGTTPGDLRQLQAFPGGNKSYDVSYISFSLFLFFFATDQKFQVR